MDRRVKYSGHKHTVNKSSKVIKKNLDMDILNLLCSYTISANRNIRRGAYVNLNNFINCLDKNVYNNEPDKLSRIDFISKGLEARINLNITNPTMIINYINGGMLSTDFIDMSNIIELSNAEIDFVNRMVSESLYYTFIDPEMEILSDLCIRWQAANFDEKPLLSNEIKSIVSGLYDKFRKSDVESTQNVTFSLRPDRFNDVIADIRNKVGDPSRMMITGMQGFNRLIGGGFFASRAYLLLGITGVGKSLTMLNIAYQMKKYNRNIISKDPTKIPCIVYITMENDIYETVERLYTICTGLDMKDCSIEDIVNRLRNEGELYLNDESPIDIIIKFVPNRSVDTSYLYTMVEDLEDEGYETLCVMLDHIKRIRSIEQISDVRLELGAVVNECKTFAEIKDLIFISDSHLNRDAAATIDKGSNNSDLTRLLGKQNIGESLLMLDNIDCGIIINKEYDTGNSPYMVFKRIKMRYKNDGLEYMCQPLDINNTIKFIEDINTNPVYKESLCDIDYSKQIEKTSKGKSTNIKKSNYTNVSFLDDDEDYIIEDKIGVYNIDTVKEKEEKEEFKPIMKYMSDSELEEYYTTISDILCNFLIS